MRTIEQILSTKEDIITYDTAILAKERGFDWRVSTYYMSIPAMSDDGVDIRLVEEWTRFENMNKHDGYVSAPSQSRLKKWLREIHKIEVWTTKEQYKTHDIYTSTISNYNKIVNTYPLEDGILEIPGHTHATDAVHYNSVEKALVIALIKLI